MKCKELEFAFSMNGVDFSATCAVNDYVVESDLQSEEQSIEEGTVVLDWIHVMAGDPKITVVAADGELAVEDDSMFKFALYDAILDWERDNNPVDWATEREERAGCDAYHASIDA